MQQTSALLLYAATAFNFWGLSEHSLHGAGWHHFAVVRASLAHLSVLVSHSQYLSDKNTCSEHRQLEQLGFEQLDANKLKQQTHMLRFLAGM